MLGRYVWTVQNGTPQASTSLAASLSGGGASGTSISVDPGTDVTDTATLSGANTATAGGTVIYGVYSDDACTHEVASGGTVDVTDGAVPASSAATLAGLGTYFWGASYSGDTANAPSSSCAAVETVTVLPATTTSIAVYDSSTNSPWNGAEVTGASAYGTSTVSGVAGYPPTGTVTYDLYADGDCSGSALVQEVTMVAGAAPDSPTTPALAAGPQSLRATYSGDGTYDPSSSGCASFSVNRATASVGTDHERRGAQLRVGTETR